MNISWRIRKIIRTLRRKLNLRSSPPREPLSLEDAMERSSRVMYKNLAEQLYRPNQLLDQMLKESPTVGGIDRSTPTYWISSKEEEMSNMDDWEAKAQKQNQHDLAFGRAGNERMLGNSTQRPEYANAAAPGLVSPPKTPLIGQFHSTTNELRMELNELSQTIYAFADRIGIYPIELKGDGSNIVDAVPQAPFDQVLESISDSIRKVRVMNRDLQQVTNRIA